MFWGGNHKSTGEDDRLVFSVIELKSANSTSNINLPNNINLESLIKLHQYNLQLNILKIVFWRIKTAKLARFFLEKLYNFSFKVKLNTDFHK